MKLFLQTELVLIYSMVSALNIIYWWAKNQQEAYIASGISGRSAAKVAQVKINPKNGNTVKEK